eukprot:jgi/Pico_ML_1/51436/g2466.t1
MDGRLERMEGSERMAEQGTGITKLVIPASLSLAEGLQTKFKFLVNFMEQVDAGAMAEMEVIDLSMNSLMLNFLFNQLENLHRLEVLDVSGNYVHEDNRWNSWPAPAPAMHST